VALVKCRECGQEVSDQAEVCPNCGIKHPKKKANGCLIIVGLLVLLVIVTIVGSSSGSNSSSGGGQNSASQPSQSSSESACSSDWHVCKDNADLVNNYQGWSSVQSACQNKVDSEVQYGEPKWPGFWAGGPFSNFYPGTDYISTGIAVVVEKDVQIENAFGAMVHSTAICRYDLSTQTVLDASWSPN
jgi:hypothetical protein